MAQSPCLVAQLSETEIAGEGRLATIFRETHGHIQKIVEELWPADEVVVTIKTIDVEDPNRLFCHNIFERLPQSRKARLKKFNYPKTIPFLGSVSGDVFDKGEPIFIEDASKVPEIFDPDLYSTFDGLIRSMAALPIRLGGSVVAVLKLDSSRANLFPESDSDIRVLLDAFVAQFELAIRAFDMKFVAHS